MNLAFAFIVGDIKDGKFRYFYAHANNSLLDWYKILCTIDNVAKLKDIHKNASDVFESCSGERMNTKRKFTNLTVFVVLLKDVAFVCKDKILPKSHC